MQLAFERSRPAALNLDPVRPLLDYLHWLPQGCSDRALSWEEDMVACEILLALELPDASRKLDDLILYYAAPEYYPSRTLCTWYAIAQSVARSYQKRS